MGQNIQLQDDNGFGLIQEQNRTAMSNIANVVALNTQRRRAQAETLAGLAKLKNLNPDKFRNAEIGVTEEGQILGNDQYNNGLNLNKKDLSVAGGDTKYDMQFGSTLGKDKINQLTDLRNAINGTTPGPAMQNRINNDANDSDAINETKGMVTDSKLNSDTYKVPANVLGRSVGTSPQFQSVATSTASGKHDEAGVSHERNVQEGNSSITGNDYTLTKETNNKQWIDTTKDDLEALKVNMVMESAHNNAMAAMGIQGGSKTFENIYNDRLKELYGRSKVLEEKGMTTQKLEHLGSTSLEATGQNLQESQSAHYGKSANTSYSLSINTGNSDSSNSLDIISKSGTSVPLPKTKDGWLTNNSGSMISLVGIPNEEKANAQTMLNKINPNIVKTKYTGWYVIPSGDLQGLNVELKDGKIVGNSQIAPNAHINPTVAYQFGWTGKTAAPGGRQTTDNSVDLSNQRKVWDQLSKDPIQRSKELLYNK